MSKSNRLGDFEIPSLQNYSIAVRGAATPVLALLGGRSPQIRVRCWHVPVTQSRAFEHPVVLAVGTAAGRGRRLNGYIFLRRGFGHPTSERPLVSNDFQACCKTNNRAPLTRPAMPLRLYNDPFVGSSRRRRPRAPAEHLENWLSWQGPEAIRNFSASAEDPPPHSSLSRPARTLERALA
jgi:hypothetical protein